MAETPTAETADENDDDPDDEHEYVNTETDENIESKRDIDKWCSKQLLNANNLTTKLLPNTRFKKKKEKKMKNEDMHSY